MHLWFDKNGTLFDDKNAGLPELVKRMKDAGHDMSILTTAEFGEEDKIKMQQMGYDPKDFIHIETGLEKSRPASYIATAEKFGQNLQEVFFVDDHPMNVAFAEYAGVHAVTYENPKQLENYFIQNGLLKLQ